MLGIGKQDEKNVKDKGRQRNAEENELGV